MAKFKGTLRSEADSILSRLGHHHITVTAKSDEGDIRICLEERDGVVICSIITFEDRYTTGRYLYQGPLTTLTKSTDDLLKHMMFEHAQKMLMGEVA